jgi:hypothetical protein
MQRLIIRPGRIASCSLAGVQATRLTAVRVNIEILRAFVRLRRAAVVSEKLMSLIAELSTRVDTHDAVIADLVESIRQIVEGPPKGRSRPIGFTADVERKNPSGATRRR